jgi:hypothetical protein
MCWLILCSFEVGKVGQSCLFLAATKQAKPHRRHKANLPESTVSGGLWEEWKVTKLIENNQVWTVLDGDLMEIYPIEGEKPSNEVKTDRPASSQSAPCQAASGSSGK